MVVSLYQKRARRWLSVIEASDDSKTQDGQTGDSIRIDSQGSTTKLIGASCGEKDRDQLNARKNHGNSEWIFVSSVLDFKGWILLARALSLE